MPNNHVAVYNRNKNLQMHIPSAFLLIIWSYTTHSLPFAPPAPDFLADFSQRSAKSDLIAVVDEDELQSLRRNGFQEQLKHLRQKTIGRNMAGVKEEMVTERQSMEDISEFSLDSSEIDSAINDITVPSSTNLKKSSKFAELAAIHNTDSSNKYLPPYAFSEDGEETETVTTENAFRPSSISLTTTISRSTTSVPSTTTLHETPITTHFVSVDRDVELPRKVGSLVTGSTPIRLSTTTMPTTTTTLYFFPPLRPQTISSSTTLLPMASRATRMPATTQRPLLFSTEFTIQPKAHMRGEGSTQQLRERIRSTNQMLNLLGDRIEGIDQAASRQNGAPQTGVLTNIHNRGEVKRRNYRIKQWGRTGDGRREIGRQTYTGQFNGMAYGSIKQRGSQGFTMRKKIAKLPWRGYKTTKLGRRRPDGMRPIVEKKTTELAVEPYGSTRIRGVKQSERRNSERKVGDQEKSFAQALLETEEASMRQLKKTLRQIRDVVRFKMSSNGTSTATTTTTTKTSTSTTTARSPIFVKPHRVDSSFYNGIFELRLL
uniref:Uncharacterized protein n=2 Tax=Caenorhabditis japonica TaxID=281687 RepID=A0A8R1HQV3_CAEJA